jgi:hypothetical protein
MVNYRNEEICTQILVNPLTQPSRLELLSSFPHVILIWSNYRWVINREPAHIIFLQYEVDSTKKPSTETFRILTACVINSSSRSITYHKSRNYISAEIPYIEASLFPLKQISAKVVKNIPLNNKHLLEHDAYQEGEHEIYDFNNKLITSITKSAREIAINLSHDLLLYHDNHVFFLKRKVQLGETFHWTDEEELDNIIPSNEINLSIQKIKVEGKFLLFFMENRNPDKDQYILKVCRVGNVKVENVVEFSSKIFVEGVVNTKSQVLVALVNLQLQITCLNKGTTLYSCPLPIDYTLPCIHLTKTYCDVTMSSKEGHKLLWIGFHH